MSKVRVLENLDGSVSVVHPAPKSRLKDETEADWLKRVFDRATPKDATFKDVEKTDLPATREVRGAWEFDSVKGAKVNEVKADVIRAEKLEAEAKL